jgi:hypothetical protein
MEWLLALLPDEYLPVVVVGLALAVMMGILSFRRVIAILGIVVLLLLFAPFIEALLEQLPWWVQVLFLVGIGLSILQVLASFLIGREAAASMAGTLAADAVRFAFRMVFLPFRAVWWAARRF